jgi:hypothetical protein
VDGVVGRGTLLAGRYRMSQPIDSDLSGAAAWSATDQILDRAVRVAILTAGHVPQALDAARRAALVTDPRLVRVLDVGEHEGVAYLVTEPVTGPSLAELVAHRPLPADQARAIIGEAAAALEAARRRGVHHLALRPSVLHVTGDNRVLLTGLAVDGALLGQGLGDARSTTRADTVGLVALLYAALTGRWPGPTLDGATAGRSTTGLPAAPVLSGAPVAPTELVAGVPNDLDTLCAVTLGSHDDGPHSPAELVLELEPWGDILAAELSATVPAADSGPTTVVPDPPSLPPGPPTVRRTSVRSVFAEQPAGAADRPGTPPPAAPAQTATFAAAADAGPAAVAAARTGAVAGGAAAALGSAPRDVPAAALAPTTALPVRGTPPGRDQGTHPRAFDELVGAREAIVTKRFDPTRLVLAVVLLAVIVGVVLAFQALTRPSTVAAPSPAARPRPSASAPASTPAAAQSPPPSASPNPATAPVVASGQALDPPPQGDNNEHPEAAPLAVDGNAATVWFTRTYKSPTFAGLKKGVGYAINLAAPATVTTVTLQVKGTGGQVEVRATDPATPTQGPVLAAGPLSASTVLTLSTPTPTQRLVLWFTALPQTADGSNRLELAEVTVS